ncbi:MAG: AMP-dependent synthetase/ligase [Isosphaeraceae bacterium]
MAYSSLASMHRAIAERLGPRIALRYKQWGLYHDLSWHAYRRQADRAAAGLVTLGVEQGDRVGLLAENRLEWLVADIAILSAGAVGLPMHAPLAPKQVEFQLSHSGTRGVIVSSQSQADKVLASLDQLPSLEFIISFDPVHVNGRIRQLTWDALMQLGHRERADASLEVQRREQATTRDDLATLIYTSGTTGVPKGVMLSHGNLLSNAEGALEATRIWPDDVLLSWLPYSHIYARTCDHYLTMLAESVVCLAENHETLMTNLAETQPTWMTAVPRFYEKVWAAVEGLPPEAHGPALRRMFGPRLRQLSSGGAPLPRHVAAGFEAAGVPLLEGYGLTESSPVISFNRLGHNKVGTVGQPIPGVEVRIDVDGEVLTKGPHVMMGYWHDPEATAAVIEGDWLRTGDVGQLDDDGYLSITDRKKDLIVTAGGKNVSPAEIERLLVSDPFIDQAVVIGDRRPCITALIVPNLPALEAKLRDLGGSLDVADGLIQAEPVRAFLAERIDRVMQAVSQPERVREFLLLAQPFSLADGELTATLKIRRRYILDKHKDLIEGLYKNHTLTDNESCDVI